MITNPYQPPSVIEADERATHVERATRCDFGVVIRRWETLRLVYNAVLVMIVLLFTAVAYPKSLSDAEFWICLTIGGAIANLCYMTGPAIEGYATWFGRWHLALTILLFLAGTALTAILAVNCIAAFSAM